MLSLLSLVSVLIKSLVPWTFDADFPLANKKNQQTKCFGQFFFGACRLLSGTKIASQNRSDHGGRKPARNHSAAEIAGFFASPKNR